MCSQKNFRQDCKGGFVRPWEQGCGCPTMAPSEMGRKYKLNCISNGVGRWLAAAKRISENKTAFGCCQIEFYIEP